MRTFILKNIHYLKWAILGCMCIFIGFQNKYVCKQFNYIESLKNQKAQLTKDINYFYLSKGFDEQFQKYQDEFKVNYILKYPSYFNVKPVNQEIEVPFLILEYIQECEKKIQAYNIELGNNTKTSHFGFEEYYLSGNLDKMKINLQNIHEVLSSMEYLLEIISEAKPLLLSEIAFNSVENKQIQTKFIFESYTESLRHILNKLITANFPIFLKNISIESVLNKDEKLKDLKRISLDLVYDYSIERGNNKEMIEVRTD